jgi:hypothetical protein
MCFGSGRTDEARATPAVPQRDDPLRRNSKHSSCPGARRDARRPLGRGTTLDGRSGGGSEPGGTACWTRPDVAGVVRALGLGGVGRGALLGGVGDAGGTARFGRAGNAGAACILGLGAEVLSTGAAGVVGGTTEVALSARFGGGGAAHASGLGMTNARLRVLAPPSTGASSVRSLDL